MPDQTDMTKLSSAVANGDEIAVGHNIAGNRLRMSKKVRLQTDAGRWRDTLPEEKQRLLWLALGWLLRCYGYKK